MQNIKKRPSLIDSINRTPITVNKTQKEDAISSVGSPLMKQIKPQRLQTDKTTNDICRASLTNIRVTIDQETDEKRKRLNTMNKKSIFEEINASDPTRTNVHMIPLHKK
eukprot:UN31999